MGVPINSRAWSTQYNPDSMDVRRLNVLTGIVNELIAKEQYEAALPYADRAIELAPSNRCMVRARAGLNGALQRHEAAVADLSRLLELAPHDFDVWCTRAYVQAELGWYDAALQDLTEALELDRDQTVGALFACGRVHEAMQYVLRELRVLRARARIFSKLGRHADALADCSRMLELAPNEANTYIARGACEHNLKMHRAALADYDQAVCLAPRNADALCGRAMARLMLNQDAEALAALTEHWICSSRAACEPCVGERSATGRWATLARRWRI